MQHKTPEAIMTTFLGCLNHAQQEGYTENYKVTPDALTTADGAISYQPHEVKVVNFYRFEGASDPDENSILYLIETSDGKKGTLSDVYGSQADPFITAFMKEVELSSKQISLDEQKSN